MARLGAGTTTMMDESCPAGRDEHAYSTSCAVSPNSPSVPLLSGRSMCSLPEAARRRYSSVSTQKRKKRIVLILKHKQQPAPALTVCVGLYVSDSIMLGRRRKCKVAFFPVPLSGSADLVGEVQPGRGPGRGQGEAGP